MKRIFEVNIMFFETKLDAKIARGPLIPATDRRPPHYTHTISKGPDHIMFGVKGNPRTHSHNNRAGGHGNGFPSKKRH